MPAHAFLSDRINGKYTLLGGLLVAGADVGLTVHTLSLSVSSWQLVFPLAVTGIGMGFVFAPLTTLAMRDVQPALAGAASGFLFTTRQVGQVLGSAVIGSVLANRVASQLPIEAGRLAARVPAGFGGRFVHAFQQASQGSQDFCVGQPHGAAPSSATPHAVAQQIAALSHEVWGESFLNGARLSVGICAGVLLLTLTFATALRGGRSAHAARRPEAAVQEPAA